MEFAELIKITRCERVRLNRPHSAVLDGTLCITGHHMILASRDGSEEEQWVSLFWHVNPR